LGLLKVAFNNTVMEKMLAQYHRGVGGFFEGAGYVISSLTTLGMKKITYLFVCSDLNKNPKLFQGVKSNHRKQRGSGWIQGGASFIPGQTAPTKK